MKYSEKIHNYIVSEKDSLISLVSELVSVRSVMSDAAENAPFGKENARVLDIMLGHCRHLGLKTVNIGNAIGYADFGDDPGLAVLCHLDVVPEGEGWKADPFTLRCENDRLIGRGTSDDKGPAAAALFAVKAVMELGLPLKKGIRLIFGTNEENGSADLNYYLREEKMPPMVFTPDGEYPVINIEKGMIRLRLSCDMPDNSLVISFSGGSVINAVPASAEAALRNIIPVPEEKFAGTSFECARENDFFSVRARGVSAHASTPESGKNAVTALLGLIAESFPECEEIIRLSELFPYGETDGSSLNAAEKDDISGELTAVLSILELKDNRLSAYVDVRFPVSCTSSRVIGNISRTAAEKGFGCEVILADEPHHTDENSPFVRTLLKVYGEIMNVEAKCIAIGGGTYVHHIDGGVAFGAQFPGEDVNMHGAEEYITIEGLLKNAEIMANAMTELCLE